MTNNGLTRDRLSVMALLVFTVAILVVCVVVAAPFFPALTWALALAVLAYPMHAWLERRLKRRGLAAFVSVFLVTLIIVVPTVFITSRVVAQARHAISQFQSGQIAGYWERLKASNPYAEKAGSWLEQNSKADEQVAQVAQQAGSKVPALISGTIAGLIQLFVALFTLFFFFRDRDQVLKFARGLLPLQRREADRVFRRVSDTIYATIYGQVVVSIIQGGLGGTMFWLLGLPAPLLWGTAMALLSIIPMSGAFIIWIPAAIVLAIKGMWVKAAILAGWGTIVVGTIDNFLYPALVGDRLRMHTLLIFFAVLGGIVIFGASGLVLGPLAIALALALVDIWSQRTAHGRAAEDTVQAA